MKLLIKLIKSFKINMPSKYDRGIHASVIILMLLGTLMILSCSVGETITNTLAVLKTIIKQVLFVCVAYFTMVNVANYFSLEKILKVINYIGAFLLVLLGACLLFDGAGGAKSWIYIPLPFIEVSIQPSEFMKVYMLVCMACYVEKAKRNMKLTCWNIISFPFSIFFISLLIILWQNDAGSLLVLTLICAICLMIPSHPNLQKFQNFVFGAMMFGMFLVFILMSDWGMEILDKIPFIGSHIVTRFEMSANPWQDEYGKGLQLINSLYAFASGGWKGLGLGQSIQKMQYLPAASTDYILAITVEELGIFGFGTILIGYSVIIFKLFKYAMMSKREGYKIIYMGTAAFIFVHFVLNVGGVTGLIPLTGIPLLFISAGASSLVSICMAIGICQGLISKENNLRAKNER